jgi:hypothetical protein
MPVQRGPDCNVNKCQSLSEDMACAVAYIKMQ